MIALPAAQQLKKEFASNRINIFAALTIFLNRDWRAPQSEDNEAEILRHLQFAFDSKTIDQTYYTLPPIYRYCFLQPWVGARRY